MSRSLRSLGKILRILNPPLDEKKNSSRSSSEPVFKLEGLLKPLFHELKVLQPSFRLLDARLPIREGNAKIDLVGLNEGRDLILLWVFELLTEEKLLRIIPDYDWVRKNLSLFQHFFPLKKGEASPIKVWLVAGEVSPDFGPLLSYLKEIPFQIFHFQRKEKGGVLGVKLRPWKVRSIAGRLSPSEKPRPAPPQEASLLPKPAFAPSPLHPQEVKDLLADLPSEGVNVEDEITDPYCPVSDLE